MSETSSHKINGWSSIFLDLVRLLAALIVLFVHTYEKWTLAELRSLHKTDVVAHSAVIIFFVLSGYVIAYTSQSNNRGPRSYAISRLSRLYSILIPAIVITAIIHVCIFFIDADSYEQNSRGAAFPRYLITAAFLNEIWLFSAAPLINSPLWSLSFEFWYYVIFGLWFYWRKSSKGIVLLTITCLFIGPKILLMLPIWCLGVFAYRIRKPKIQNQYSWLLVFGAIAGASYLVVTLPPMPGEIGLPPFFFANQYITDYVIALFIALGFYFLPVCRPINSSLTSNFRKLADLTYPIYVLHFPFLILFHTIAKNYNLEVGPWVAMIVVFTSSSLLGLALEKQRGIWIKLFKRLLKKRAKSKKHVKGVLAG